MRIATIDVGTNTAQLLVAERDGPALCRLHVAERFVRLGEGVDTSGRIGPSALERLRTTLREHKATAEHYGAERIVVGATSATRDAANKNEVVAFVKRETGLSVDILSGEEEATWSFAAACAPFDDLTGRCMVVDIGGGSTELITGVNPSGRHPHYPDAIDRHVSLDVGCVRLTERCFPAQPPPERAVRAAAEAVGSALTSSRLEVPPDIPIIGTAGTATALALVHAGPDSTWDALHGGGFALSAGAARTWRERLLQLSTDEILALHPRAMPGRADVFPVGVMILDAVLQHVGAEACRVSPYELRYGLALRALRDP